MDGSHSRAAKSTNARSQWSKRQVNSKNSQSPQNKWTSIAGIPQFYNPLQEDEEFKESLHKRIWPTGTTPSVTSERVGLFIREIVKCKGIYQSERTGALSFDSLCNLVSSHLDPSTPAPLAHITVPQTTILRPKMDTIQTREFLKNVRHVNNECSVTGTDPLTAKHRL